MAAAAQMVNILHSLPTSDLLWEISNLVVMKEMKVAIRETAKCGMLVGGITMVSGLLAGPPGMLLGGVAGSFLAYFKSQGKFKTVPEIISQDLTEDQREKLARELRKCLSSQNIFTIVELVLRLQSNDLILDAVAQVVKQFITSDLAMQIM